MKVKEDYQFKGQITMFDILNLDSWSGRTSQELSVQETPKEQTSKQSSKKSVKSLSRKSPIFLYLKRDGLTQGASKEWVMMEHPSLLPGDCTMLNTGESPNEERESHLSQILEVTPPPRYSLSARACQGILNRANKRGKQLPEVLEKALTNQAATQSRYEGGVEVDSLGHKAGKGALVQTELSGTLGVSQDQTLFQNVPDNKCLNSWDVQSKHIQPESGIAEALYAGECRGGGGESYVLQDKKEPILLESNQNHATIQTNGISTSLPAAMGEGGGYVPMVVDKPCAYDGSQISPTLTANNADGSQRMPDKGNFNAVIGVDECAEKSSACHYENISPTLATTHHGEPAVCYGLDRASFNAGQNAKFDFSVEEDKAPTVVARGPGGGNDGIIGSLCARDYKGVGNQYVEEGKCIVQLHTRYGHEDK